jgi:hypothetical protein
MEALPTVPREAEKDAAFGGPTVGVLSGLRFATELHEQVASEAPVFEKASTLQNHDTHPLKL